MVFIGERVLRYNQVCIFSRLGLSSSRELGSFAELNTDLRRTCLFFEFFWGVRVKYVIKNLNNLKIIAGTSSSPLVLSLCQDLILC